MIRLSTAEKSELIAIAESLQVNAQGLRDKALVGFKIEIVGDYSQKFRGETLLRNKAAGTIDQLTIARDHIDVRSRLLTELIGALKRRENKGQNKDKP